MLDLKTLNRWNVQRDRANAADAATSPEAANARAGMAEIEAAHPDIAARSAAIQRILDAPPAPFGMPFRVPGEKKPPPRAGPAIPASLSEAAARLAEGAAAHLAQGLVDELAGGNRQTKLERGDVEISFHECAPGDVCLEVRATAADIRSKKENRDGNTPLDEILIEIEEELLGKARGER